MTGGSLQSRGSCSLFDRILRRLGIGEVSYRALVRAYLLMDFRNQHFAHATNSGPRALITPLFWVVGQNLLISGVACGVLFARVDVFFFILVNLAMSMLVTATSIIVEFNEVVLDPDDLDVIGHRPISVRTYSAARVTNLMGYLLLVTASMNVFPPIVLLGLTDSHWAMAPAYLLAAVVGDLLVAGLVILAYTVLQGGRPGAATRELLAWTQVALILILGYGGQVVLRDPSDRLEMMAYDLPAWLAYTPPGQLTRGVTCAATDGMAAGWPLAAGAVIVAGIWSVVIWRLSVAYEKMQPGGGVWGRSSLPRFRRSCQIAGPLTRLLTGRHEDRTAFWLCSTMLRRDHNLKMRTYPSVSLVFALAAIGWFGGQLGDPMTVAGPKCLMSLICLYALAIPLPTLVYNLRFSSDHAASWVLGSAPLGDGPAFAEGLRKAVAYRVMLPALVALAIVFAVTWRDMAHVAIHAVIGWLVIIGAGHASQIGALRNLPFSAPVARGATFGPIAPLTAAVSSAAMFLGVLHFFAIRRPVSFALYLAGLIGLVMLLRFAARRVMSVRFSMAEPYE